MNDLQPSTFNLPPAVGDHVFFRLDRGPNTGDWRPAVIVRTWGASAGGINLLVFTDCINDDIEKVLWAVSRVEGLENGDWSRTPGYAPAATTTAVTLVDETPAPFGALAQHLAINEAAASTRLDGQTVSADETPTPNEQPTTHNEGVATAPGMPEPEAAENPTTTEIVPNRRPPQPGDPDHRAQP